MTTALERFVTVRQSRLAAFDACGLMSYFSETYDRGWSTHLQAAGQLFHRTMERILLTLVEHKATKIPVTVALGILDEVLRQADVDDWCHQCGSQIVGREQPEGSFPMMVCESGCRTFSNVVNVTAKDIADLKWMVAKFAGTRSFDTKNLQGVELRMGARLSYPDPAGGMVERLITGIVDSLAISGHRATIDDWKSGWYIPPESSPSVEAFFQQILYSWLTFKTYPDVMVIHANEWYPRKGAVRSFVIERDSMVDNEQMLSQLVERFDRAWTDMVFAPTPGAWCGYCPRSRFCPIDEDTRIEQGAPFRPEDASRLAAEFQKVDRVRRVLRQSAKGIVETTGEPLRFRGAKGDKLLGWVEDSSGGRTFKIHAAPPESGDTDLVRQMRTAARRARAAAEKRAAGSRAQNHAEAPESAEKG